MSLAADKAQIIALTRDLANHWELTRETWRDDKALEFQHQYIEELIANVEKVATVIDDLDKLIAKIRSDCE